MRPEHLDLLYAAGSPSITPDGSRVVVAVSHPDLDADAARSALWVVATDGSSTTRLTVGDSDGAAAVSPDGSTVAFLRSVDGGAPQIHVVRLDGGEPVRLTDQPLGAGAPVWSPEGGRLAWTARVPEPGRYGTKNDDDEEVEPDAEPPRLITEFTYRLDNLGYTRDRREHVFVADVPDLDRSPGDEAVTLPVEPRQLTDGDADDASPSWSPDGDRIAFVSARHATREVDLRSAIHVVATHLDEPAADPPAVTGGDLGVEAVRWLADGRIAFTGADLGPTGHSFIRPSQVWITEPVTGDDVVAVRMLTDEATISIEDGPRGMVPVAGGLLVTDTHRGGVRLLRVDPDAADPEPDVLVDGDVGVTGVAAAADAIVVTATTADRVGDVAVVTPDSPTDRLTWLTDVSARLRADAAVAPPVDIAAPTPDGHEVHGWAVLPDPEKFGAGPHPVLLDIHGGPLAQYVSTFFDEAQVYAGAGYAVLMCNPRGSLGYGLEHGRAIVGAMGTVDADDIITFLDHALSDDELPLDGDRVGVMGGSYGGYMTALLTTRTDRFAAAIVERGYLDPKSFVGSSDIGWFFPAEYHGSIDDAVAQSPMVAVDNVTTPTLVIHSEADWRTPVEQGQRWFTELKLRGVETELLLFPAESHELSRSGRPRHRRARFEHILDWWARHLPVA